MKSQNSTTASPFFNNQIGQGFSGKSPPRNPAQEDLERGYRLRKIDLIKDCRELGEELAEVWEDD